MFQPVVLYLCLCSFTMAERDNRSTRRNGRDESRKRGNEGHSTRNHPGDVVESYVENTSRNSRNAHGVSTVVRYQCRKYLYFLTQWSFYNDTKLYRTPHQII